MERADIASPALNELTSSALALGDESSARQITARRAAVVASDVRGAL